MNCFTASLTLLLLSTVARSEGLSKRNYRLLEVDRLDIEYHKLNASNRDPYAPDYTGRWKERAALKWDISVLGLAYWRNNTHTETIDTGAVKTVGWEWEAGVGITKYFELFHHHHSRHIMDEPAQRDYRYTDTNTQFPVEDSFGIRIRFIHKESN